MAKAIVRCVTGAECGGHANTQAILCRIGRFAVSVLKLPTKLLHRSQDRQSRENGTGVGQDAVLTSRRRCFEPHLLHRNYAPVAPVHCYFWKLETNKIQKSRKQA